jgi:hypothetical protein
MEKPICNFCKNNDGEVRLVKENVNNSGSNLVECVVCGLRYYSPRPSFESILSTGFGQNENAKKEADHLWENLSFSKVEDRDKQEKLLTDYYINMLKWSLSGSRKVNSIFEVGGSIGYFLNVAKTHFGINDLAGCELNKYSVEKGKEHFGLYNYKSGMFSNYKPKRTYDMGVMLDYIEHTYTPYDDLKKIHSMLNKDGILLLKTFAEELDKQGEMIDPPWHSHHIFSRVLGNMLLNSGFIPINKKTDGYIITVVARKI